MLKAITSFEMPEPVGNWYHPYRCSPGKYTRPRLVLSKELVIVSDDAGQFNVFLHSLCWIHANRAIDKIVPFTEQAKNTWKTSKIKYGNYMRD